MVNQLNTQFDFIRVYFLINKQHCYRKYYCMIKNLMTSGFYIL